MLVTMSPSAWRRSALAIPQPCGQRLYALVEPRIRDEIESREHERIRDVVILLEIVRHPPRQDGPVLLRDRPPRPTVVARVDPAVPEGKRDVQAPQLGRGTGGELVLEPIEPAADRVVALGLVVGRIRAQLSDERVARRNIG